MGYGLNFKQIGISERKEKRVKVTFEEIVSKLLQIDESHQPTDAGSSVNTMRVDSKKTAP